MYNNNTDDLNKYFWQLHTFRTNNSCATRTSSRNTTRSCIEIELNKQIFSHHVHVYIVPATAILPFLTLNL